MFARVTWGSNANASRGWAESLFAQETRVFGLQTGVSLGKGFFALLGFVELFFKFDNALFLALAVVTLRLAVTFAAALAVRVID